MISKNLHCKFNIENDKEITKITISGSDTKYGNTVYDY
jgi:hypothetical protein